MNSFLMCLSTNCLLWRIIASTQYEWLTTFLQGGAKISLHYYNAHVCKMFFCFWKLLLLNSALQFTIYNDDTKREKKLAKLICFNCNFKFGENISKTIRFLFIQYKKVHGLYSENLSNLPTLKLMLNIKSIRVIQSLNTLSAKVKLTWQATTITSQNSIAQTYMHVGIYVCWWVQIRAIHI